MKHTVSLTIPNEKRYIPLCIETIRNALHLAKIEDADSLKIVAAARELLFNAVYHAYGADMSGTIDIDIRFLPHGVKISVHDMGTPFDFDSHMRSGREGGLKRAEGYVDELSFANLGKKGKVFLIYNNYTYSYYKSLFYYPKRIAQLNQKGEIASVVAETKEGRIVGHFALVRLSDSNIAEIGVAVVDPDYKGKGIMNSMLGRIEQRAREMRLDAIFGEALMLHPFSQRANLHHGFGESALLLGIVPNSVSLTDPNAVRTKKRASVLVGYKILSERRRRGVFIPKIYKELVERIYSNCDLEIVDPKGAPCTGAGRMRYELSSYTQSGTLVIDDMCENFTHTLRHNLSGRRASSSAECSFSEGAKTTT